MVNFLVKMEDISLSLRMQCRLVERTAGKPVLLGAIWCRINDKWQELCVFLRKLRCFFREIHPRTAGVATIVAAILLTKVHRAGCQQVLERIHLQQTPAHQQVTDDVLACF